MLSNESTAYAPPLRRIHWATAVLFIIAVADRLLLRASAAGYLTTPRTAGGAQIARHGAAVPVGAAVAGHRSDFHEIIISTG
jgi:hypothetical protein